ncbi:flagellar basal-body MS-ring/collar protein FliF [Thermotoga sp. KOL6]|uniref:flagellar basal-body MS-ring/collar protein FliF n=1 Tax=Thermotoga sp. KOL6 TaxID=126741 RepID=UPI000C78EFC7|nr:flagellar basal-body MS-ring/collar protein FliF [Thermotoga sp. KOL6]PLV58977.1 flagellar M-ring protein FliF [Thermotoga sp. KOL6]
MNFLESIKSLWKKTLNTWNSLSRERKFLVGGIMIAIIVSIVLFLIVATTPHYRLLVAGLSEEEAGTVIQKLEEMNVPYKVTAGGDIYVPDKYNVYELRMKLASEGTLGSSRKGFSILNENSFGATSFDKQVKYQIALQEELERSIMTIKGVKNARVHLVLPKYTYYVRGEMAEPRASVLVVLERPDALTREQVKGIVELVSGAVEGLKPENVRVVDNYSRSLSDMLKTDEETFLASNKLELKQQVEKYYESKIKKALENVFGPGRVEVIPDVSLNWTKIETEMKKYEAPARREGLVRSQETETEKSQNAPPSSGGEVGTESNIPPLSYPSITGEGTSTYERTHTITNYELNEIYQKILQNHEGEISSLSIAVIIDASSTVLQNGNNWSDIINDLVEKGVGSITSSASLSVAVAFLPFDRTIEKTLEREIELIQARKRFTIYSVGIALLGFLLFLLIYILIVQFRRMRARKLAEERRRRLEEEIKEVLQEELKEEEEISPEEKEILELMEELENIFSRSPSDIAEIVRLWFFERG